jgi:hypothetical protein
MLKHLFGLMPGYAIPLDARTGGVNTQLNSAIQESSLVRHRAVNSGISTICWFSLLTLCTVLSTMTGCAKQVIKSDHTEVCNTAPEDSPCKHNVPVGLVYSLPKGQVLLAAFRKPITSGDIAKAQADVATAQQAVADAMKTSAAAKATQTKNAVPGESDAQKTQDKAAVDAANASLAASQASAESAKQALDEIKKGAGTFTFAQLTDAYSKVKKDEDELKQAQEALEQANKSGNKAEIASATITRDKAQNALADDTKKRKEVQDGQPKYVETFTLTPLAIVPDDTQRFVANLSHSKWRDDTLKLSVVNGLLTTTSAQSTDQMGSIISNLVSAAVGIVTFAGAGIPVVPGKTNVTKAPVAAATQPPARCEYVYAKSFDPVDIVAVKTVNDELKNQDPAAHIELDTTFSLRANQPVKRKISAYSDKDKAQIDGLVYRTPVGVGVEVLPDLGATTTPFCQLQSLPQAQTLQLFVPDSNADFIVPVEVGAMTASTFQFNFNNGMLTDYNLTRPSEIAATASIPVDIVNKIMTIPTSILKLRLDYSTAETNLASQNAALINAQSGEALALVNAKIALDTAETNLSTAELNDPTARYKALTGLVQAKQALADAIAAAAKSNAAAAQPSTSH